MPASRCPYLIYKINISREFDMRLHFRYVGNYHKHECMIELRNVGLEDGGVWKCDVEEYDWRIGRGWGDQVTRDIIVEVLRKTTITTTTTT